jgi:Zn-dependent protease
VEVPMLYVILEGSDSAGAAAWMPERNPLKQLAWDAGGIFRVLRGLVTPKEAKATANAIGGPVMIAEGLYRQVRHNPFDGLGFLRFLNVNLAVLNLLPIPVLDGGLILFSLFALIFRRRVPDVIVKGSSIFFMVVLMALMGVLVLRDSWRTYKIHTYKPDCVETNVLESADKKP